MWVVRVARWGVTPAPPHGRADIATSPGRRTAGGFLAAARVGARAIAACLADHPTAGGARAFLCATVGVDQVLARRGGLQVHERGDPVDVVEIIALRSKLAPVLRATAPAGDGASVGVLAVLVVISMHAAVASAQIVHEAVVSVERHGVGHRHEHAPVHVEAGFLAAFQDRRRCIFLWCWDRAEAPDHVCGHRLPAPPCVGVPGQLGVLVAEGLVLGGVGIVARFAAPSNSVPPTVGRWSGHREAPRLQWRLITRLISGMDLLLILGWIGQDHRGQEHETHCQ